MAQPDAATQLRGTGVPTPQTTPAALVVSMASMFIAAPLDLLTVRRQLASSVAATLPPLWTGASLAVARVPLFALTRAMTFTSLLALAPTHEPSLALFGAAGVASHGVAMIVTHPLDTWKTRRMMAAPSLVPTEFSTAAAASVRAGARRGGVFAGVGMAVATVAMAEGTALLYHASPLPSTATLLSGFSFASTIAAVCALTLATHPIDTLKRRLQVGMGLATSRNMVLVCLQAALYEPLLHLTSAWVHLKNS